MYRSSDSPRRTACARWFVSGLTAAGAWFAVLAPMAGAATIHWVDVNAPGNAPDSTGYGAVDYSYRIGKFEVTNGEYVKFLNSVASTDPYELYDDAMADHGIQRETTPDGFSYSITADPQHDWASKPVNAVSWYDAVRFANWVNNGQGDGDTETGAYTLLGGGPVPLNPSEIVRNEGARVWLPSLDEWYKAAYYDPAKGDNGGYWTFPTTSDTAPSNELLSPDPGNNANFTGSDLTSTLDGPVKLTDVGQFANSASPWGAFDIGGNLAEWSETLTPGLGMLRSSLGGSWGSLSVGLQGSNARFAFNGPAVNSIRSGFRLASVPEPTALALTMIAGCVALLAARRRQRRAHRVG